MPDPSTPDPRMYHGLKVEDMPGKDLLSQRMNFSLFRRGILPGYKSCKGLFGEALKVEFLRINAGQRTKSLVASECRAAARAQSRERRKNALLPPTPPTGDPAGAGVRVNPDGGDARAAGPGC